MKGHAKVCTKNPDGTWNYTCSCKRVKRNNLKFESSANAMHAEHERSVKRYAASH